MAFAAIYVARFTAIGIWLLRIVLVVLVGTVGLSIRDFWKSGTRWRGFCALLLCVPVLMFFGLVAVWEGPLYVAVSGSHDLEFQVDGASGFEDIQIYGPEHSKAEWRGDDIGLIWSFDWPRPQRFPPMWVRFAYGTLPAGYIQTGPTTGSIPALNPNVTYTVVVGPAMGMPDYFTLRGNSLTKAEDEYAIPVCWAPLAVSGRSDPAYVREDCRTKKVLAMSERGQTRLKAYQEKRLPYY